MSMCELSKRLQNETYSTPTLYVRMIPPNLTLKPLYGFNLVE